MSKDKSESASKRDREISLVDIMKAETTKTDEHMASATGRKRELDALRRNKKAWKFYRVFCQFRFGYLSFLLMVVILLFSFTMLMEVFFAVFLPSSRSDPNFTLRSILLLIILPFLLIIASYVFEESVRLFFDCITKKDGCLPKFRGALAVVIHYLRHKSEMPCPREDVKKYSENLEEQKADDFETIDESEAQEETQKPKISLKSKLKAAAALNVTTTAFADASYDGPDFDNSTFVISDIFLPFIFEVITIVGALIEFFDHFSVRSAFLAYISTGFIVMSVYLLSWIIINFWTNRNPKMRMLLSSCKKRNRIVKERLESLQVEKNAEFLWLRVVGYRFWSFMSKFWRIAITNGLCSCCRTKDHVELEENLEKDGNNDDETLREELMRKVDSCNPWNKLSFRSKFIFLIPSVIGGAVLSYYSFYLGWIVMGFFLIVLGNTISCRFPQIFGSTFRIFIYTFILISLIFFSSSFLIGTFVTGGDFLVEPPTAESKSHPAITKSWGNLPKYPICSFNYSSLDIIDFVLLADAAYGSTTKIQKTMLYNRFNGTALSNWQYVARNDPKVDHQCWMELLFPSINVTVIAVRGTASATDALEDLHYWFGISIMQFANIFFPFLNQLPQDFLVKILSISGLSSVTPPPVYTKLRDHVEKVRKDNDRVVLVGHSLGGAMAAMVGAYTKTPAMSFSGPGLIYSRGRFGITEENIRNYVVTVKPEHDIVPRVDALGGMVQNIDCRSDNPLTCHGTTTHACELYYTCGDKRHRDWSHATQCKDLFPRDSSDGSA